MKKVFYGLYFLFFLACLLRTAAGSYLLGHLELEWLDRVAQITAIALFAISVLWLAFDLVVWILKRKSEPIKLSAKNLGLLLLLFLATMLVPSRWIAQQHRGEMLLAATWGDSAERVEMILRPDQKMDLYTVDHSGKQQFCPAAFDLGSKGFRVSTGPSCNWQFHVNARISRDKVLVTTKKGREMVFSIQYMSDAFYMPAPNPHRGFDLEKHKKEMKERGK